MRSRSSMSKSLISSGLNLTTQGILRPTKHFARRPTHWTSSNTWGRSSRSTKALEQNFIRRFSIQLSQTQFVIARITKIVQEIHDMRKGTTTRHKSNPSREGIHERDEVHCNNSSYNTLQHQSTLDKPRHHAPCLPDTPSPLNETPVQRCPSSDPSSSLTSSAGRNEGPHKDWRAATSGHEKFADLERYSSTQSGEGPLETKPDLKKAEGKASLRGGREDSEGAGEPLDPDPDKGQARSRVLPRD